MSSSGRNQKRGSGTLRVELKRGTYSRTDLFLVIRTNQFLPATEENMRRRKIPKIAPMLFMAFAMIILVGVERKFER